MSTAITATRVTPQQYLALERASEFRNEYYDGGIHAMAGTSRLHGLIAANLLGEIRQQSKGRPCEVFAADLRVWVDATESYTYPDIVAVGGEPQLQDEVFDTLLNPTVLIEILSPSTEADDRGRKATAYRQLASLREYVLVAQDRVRVEHFARRGDDWIATVLGDPGDVLQLDSIGCAIPLREVYARTGLLPA